METRGEEVHLDKTEARAGATPGVVRYVLLIGLILAIAALSLIWIVPATQAPKDTGGAADTRRAVEQGDANPQTQPGMQSPPPPAPPGGH
ncbi:hypothetical protein WBP07_13240 [Novosphingobium sp. BL-8A]|uniref:hypothetical protein n=1 Tax=Novosphingobium sp. BL-8A TaxID=3127639 RepID=UPI0037568CC5